MKSLQTQNNQSEAAPSVSAGNILPFPIQAKLTIGSPNDHYEQQADQVADQVMHDNNSPSIGGSWGEVVQRKCTNCEHDNEKIQRKPFNITPFIQKSSADGGGIANDAVSSQIESSRGGGNPMGESTRSFMESRFGNDFSGVRIHTDSNAIQLSQNLNAQAFTVGNDVFFNQGKYNPESDSGKHLLAHELTHTVQQGGGIPVNFIQRDLAVEPSNPNAVARELTEREIQDAIRFNQATLRNIAEISNLRDVLGLSSEPAVINEEFVRTVAQWQAENNLTQDGKIGPQTARIIGREMLEESKTDATQRRPAIQMLERGITMWLSNDTYTDSASTSQKNIRFNVSIPPGLNMRDYALVNFLQGSINIISGSSTTNPSVHMYGSTVPFNFPAEQVDSIDTDPIYASTGASRWNYTILGRTFSSGDSPGTFGNIYQPGESANVNFRIGLFRVSDLPTTTTGNVGTARPLLSLNWRFSVVRDATTGTITHP